MTEEFDEDVVFENSPLFHYLHDLGHTDFETCPVASQDDDCGSGESDRTSPQDASQKSPVGRIWSAVGALCQWPVSYQRATCRALEQQLDGLFGRCSVSCILDQDVLLQEDVELIELLDPSLLTLGGPSAAASALPRAQGILASPSLWDMAGLAGLAAVLLGLCSVSEGLWSLAAAPWALALLAVAVLRGARLWLRGRMHRAAAVGLAELQALVQDGRALTGLSRKALRLVQETEVISRGFTLVSAAGSFSRASPGAMPPGQQLIGLRKALYRALRTAFRASRRATCHMLKAFPLSSEVDNVTNYVSAVPLKELGLGLGVEHLGDEQAQELTDDYSLPALKVLFQLWVGQSSECFRRLALLLSPRRLEELVEGAAQREAPPPPPPLHRSIAVVTGPLRQALAGCLGEVRRSYDFHRYFETQPRSHGPDGTSRARQTCRELNALHTSIRSLQLHLKALLSEMIILEDDLEKLMVLPGGGGGGGGGEGGPAEGEASPHAGYRELGERLRHLQPHMEASSCCWDDAVAQVERMVRRAATCTGEEEGQLAHCPPPVCHIPDAPPSYPLILDRDPVPEELEWEAYVSDSDSDDAGGCGARRDSWSDTLSPEERERQRREREESRRVLSELKAVLGMRASEVERRKWKQLLFSDQAAVTPSAHQGASESPSDSQPLVSLASVGGAEMGAGEGNRPSESAEEEEEDNDENKGEGRGGCSSDSSPLEAEPSVTEYSCGLGEATTTTTAAATATVAELHQYDGLSDEEGAELNGPLDCFLAAQIPGLSVTDRLAEIHGSEAVSFSSALAAQVAAHSHTLRTMEEQTFGDDDDDEDDDGNKEDDCDDEE